MNFVLFLVSLFVVVRGADFAVRYALALARKSRLPEHVVGFLMVAVISVFPETFISIISVLEDIPSFGLGTLFGSNVADLTVVFGLAVILSPRGLVVSSKVIKESSLYIATLFIPLLLGFDGLYSRIEGFILVLVGVLFFILILGRKHHALVKPDSVSGVPKSEKPHPKNFFYLILSLGLLLVASYFTVRFGILSAESLGVSPAFVGILVVALGTTMPELFFSIKALQKNHHNLALGDVLGTVITDATIVVGVMAMIRPFAFNSRLIHITGIFMLLAAIILFFFMKTGRLLTKRESLALFIFYLIFVWAEFNVNQGS